MNTTSIRIIPRTLAVAALIAWALTSSRADFIFDAEVPLSSDVEKAIDRAQNWLAKTQQPNGSWGTCNGVNAMSLIALMVNGGTPGHTKHGREISKAIEFIIANQKDNGYLIVGSKGSMYQHGLSTIALAEAYGMTQNPAIRECLTKAVQLTLKAQNARGGWRYNPVPLDDDLSVTVIQVMSLRAVAETGIYVPQDAIDFGIRYVKSHRSDKTMGFGYGGPNDVNWRMTAAGVVSLQSYGLSDDPSIPPAIEYLTKNIDFSARGNDRMCWYGHYYSSVALYHYGGDAWKTYYTKICQHILADWTQPGCYGDPLTTSWAILVMGTPYRYLPIYQR